RARHDDGEHAALAHERLDRASDVGGRRALRDLVAREIAEPEEQIVDGIGGARAEALVETLELALELDQHRGVEELAELGIAQELAELRLIDGERLRAALGERRVTLVDEIRHVAEEDRRRERRR